jgi:hypothetical protein
MAEIELSVMEDYIVQQFEAHPYLGSSAVTTIEARKDWSFPESERKAMGFAGAELPGIIVQNRTMYGGKLEVKALAKDCHEYTVPFVISGIMSAITVVASREGAETLMEEIIDSLTQTALLPNKWGTDGVVEMDTISGLHFHVQDSEHLHYGICTVFFNMTKAIST